MSFKTFAAGDVLTSSDVNTYLMRQSLIVCTSATRPGTPSEGMAIYETDTDLVRVYNGTAWEVGFHVGAWETYTPTIKNAYSGTDWVLGNGTVTGRYQRIGRTVVVEVTITMGSTTTFGTKTLAVDPPVTPLTKSTGSRPQGWIMSIDQSSAITYPGFVEFSPDGSFVIFQAWAAGGTYVSVIGVTSAVPFTWVSTDELKATFIYEAAA
jgi:hypothetical protein